MSSIRSKSYGVAHLRVLPLRIKFEKSTKYTILMVVLTLRGGADGHFNVHVQGYGWT